MSKFSEFLSKKEDAEECLFVFYQDTDLNESVSSTRYSIEVNYRTNVEETLQAFAKIALGFVSAGIKQHDFHVKHVYTDSPIRILVSSRNWDDGEWVGVVSWHEKDKCFVVSKGFYNKDRKTVSVQKSEKCKGDNAAEITKHVYNMMKDLKGKPDKHAPKMKSVPLRRGPKS